MDSKIDLNLLDGLTQAERELALTMLKEFSEKGESETYTHLRYKDYAEIPVDIETFLFDPRYLGNGLVDAEGRRTVFPYWVEKLKEVFPNNLDTAYNTIILTGSIGIGKSFFAVLVELYLMYRMLCLKDPYLYYGMQPIDKISFSMINITLDAARGVAWDKMQQLLQSSPWFMAHGKVTGTDNLVWKPTKRAGQIGKIELVVGSKNSHIIGRAVFCLDGDTEIVTTEGIKKIEELVGKPIHVISLDDNGNKVISDECFVEPTIKTKEEYQIELEDGTVIKCTPNHKLMLKDGSYKEAQQLTEEDELADVVGMSYFEFIDNIIKTRGQWNIPNGEYWEGHHIIPKCMGGSGRTKQKHPNIIRLYPEEHYLAHKLLAIENPDNKSLVSAWEMMIHPKGNTKREYQISAEDYAISKKLWSQYMSENNPLKESEPWNKGKTGVYSQETLEKIRAPRPHMRGIKKSQETKEKMSKATKKRYKEHPETFVNGVKGKIAITNGKTNKYVENEQQIPEGFYKGLTKSKYEIGDRDKFSKMRSEQTKGSNNPMFGKGYKLSGGNNGHATIRYTYKGITFESRKDLLPVLQKDDQKIASSTIRKLINGSVRVLNEHPILKELTWERK